MAAMATLDRSVREIVADDFRAAAVFERFGIDFCCGGRRTLAEACRDRKVSPVEVLNEMIAACERQNETVPRFTRWGVDALVAYIVRHHHAYVRRVLPSMVVHARKVAASHGGGHPELWEIAAIFEEVAEEMTAHMMKEEEILFPYIEQLALARRLGEPVPAALFGSVEKPIAMMEHEHEHAGLAMARIRGLSRGYAPPAGACTTYVTCFRELDEFERDLHVHVHLENNVLFPKAHALAAGATEGTP
jgi:regulator of cell morphogenesis and NO signaling